MRTKLTEDETIMNLMLHLEKAEWKIESFCLGQKRGCDVVAIKEDIKLLIEVKGARAADNSPTRKRAFFDSGQIKTHFGKAIVKVLDDKFKHPDYQFAIAHPDDQAIRKAIGHLIPSLKKLGIVHFWVYDNGTISMD